MIQAIPVHLSAGHFGLSGGAALLLLLGLAGLGSALLAGLGLAAFVRRRSRSFLLVALALSALLARTAVAVATMAHLIPGSLHHTSEHGLDVVMAALVLAAVYYARTVERSADPTNGDRP